MRGSDALRFLERIIGDFLIFEVASDLRLFSLTQGWYTSIHLSVYLFQRSEMLLLPFNQGSFLRP